MSEAWFIVGKVLSSWGLRGDVSVEVISTNPARFRPGSRLYAHRTPLTVTRVRTVSGKVVVGFNEVRSRDEADALKGAWLEVPEADLPPLGPDQYYHHQVLGLWVATTDGRDLGRITDILVTGANDVYVVAGDGREYLIPAIGDVVKQVDLEAGVMTIEPLPGLLD